MSRRVGLFLFFLCLSFAPCASADTLFLSCTPTVTLNGPDMLDACPAAGLSPGSKVTAIKLYLLADFQGGAPEVRDLIHVVFLPRMVKKSVLIENTRDLESPHSAR